MKIKRQNKYILAKVKELSKKLDTSSRIITQRISNPTKKPDFQLSFDSFFYQDHVTLKKYSIDHLKNSSAIKMQDYEDSTNEKWRQEQRSKMVKLIEYIDLWKNIKSNRNNILVYGNKKNNQLLPTQKKLQWNLQKQQSSLIGSTAFGTQRCNTTENPLILNRPSHTLTQNDISRDERRSRQKSQDATITNESLGKIKRKMNFQIYKLNKELLRDYLNEGKQYESSFNYLIKDEDNLQSKLKKITTLIDVLKKQKNLKAKSSNKFSQKTFRNINDTVLDCSQKNHIVSNMHNLKSIQTLKAQTQTNQSESEFTKCQISLKKLRQTCKLIQGCQDNAPRRRFQPPPVMKRKLNAEQSRKQLEDTKIDKAFEKEWQNINEQIKLKFRREAEFGLSVNKKKKKAQKVIFE